MDVATALVSSVPANDRIVTSRVACVDSRESSPVPLEVVPRGGDHRQNPRFRADFYRRRKSARSSKIARAPINEAGN